ncbi:hypothetical protein QZH41_013084, partial [Actinostola sp. cb2023]
DVKTNEENSNKSGDIDDDSQTHGKSTEAGCTNIDNSANSEDAVVVERTQDSRADSDDVEIQFKSDEKVVNDEPGELEKTQTDIDTTEHKETIDAHNEENVVQDEKSVVEDAQNTDKELPEQPSTSQTPESQNPKEQQEADSWGWGSWGSMLSQATAGLSSVIESVESSLGIPEPGEIAKKVADDEKTTETVIENEPTVTDTIPQEPSQDDSEINKSEVEGGQGSFLSGLSSVVSEGLGALEYIGKKTMDVISEGDPGLRNKRQFMSKGPTLSQMLREAKEDAEYKVAHPDYKESVMNVKLTTEFDKFQGLAHLEALEILSKESESKVEAHIIDLTKEELMTIKPLLRTIQEVVQIEDDGDDDEDEQDFETEVSSSLAELHLSHVPNKTNSVHNRVKEWIDSCITEQSENPKCRDHVEIYTAGISALAEITACSVEQFHKVAEVMLLLADESDTSALVRAQSLKKLTLCVCREVSNLASKFAVALSTITKESEDPEAIESLITTLYLESSDSSRYVQHAFKLLCPVLQQSSLSESTNPAKS